MFRGRWVAVLVAAVIVGSSFCSLESASADPPVVWAELNTDGSGELTSVGLPNPPLKWDSCTVPAGSTQPLCAPLGSGFMISTGAAAPGTFFKATAGDGSVAQSPVWHGPVRATAPPSVVGDLRANTMVTPVAGDWTGGWDGDFDALRVYACRQPDGGDCSTLTDPTWLPNTCPDGGVILDPALTGWYLRLQDTRYGVNSTFSTPVFVTTGDDQSGLPLAPPGQGYDPPAPDAVTSVTLLGPIAPATDPPPPNTVA